MSTNLDSFQFNLISDDIDEFYENAKILDSPVHKTLDFACFDCLGEPDVKTIEIRPSGFFKSGEIDRLTQRPLIASKSPAPVELFGRKWDKGSVLLTRMTSLFKLSSMEVMVINSAANLNTNLIGLNLNRSYSSQSCYFTSRKYCIQFFIFVRNFLDSICSSPNYYWILPDFVAELSKKLICFRRLLGKLTDLPEYVYLHGCHSAGNKSSQPSYHLFHLHLDLRWVYFTLLFKLNKSKIYYKNDSDSEMYGEKDDFDAGVEIKKLIAELIELSFKRFEKIENSELPRKSPFTCTCIQELWILIQSVTDTLFSEKKFWDYFNDILETMSCDLGFSPCTKVIFSLWLLCSIGKLYKNQPDIISNYVLLESLVKTVVNEELNETEMRTCLIFIEFICVKTWEPKKEPLISLWDYYHKKLNSNFYILGAPPGTTAIISKTSNGFIQQVRSFLEHRSSVGDSYQHFLRLISLHLKKTQDSWNLIKGRIFSKLSPQKLLSLTQIGEYHLISLFLAIAISNGLSLVESKIIEVFTTMKKSKGVSSDLLKGQMAFAILKLNNNENCGKIIQPVIEHINSLCYDTMTGTITGIKCDSLRIFAEEMEFILKLNKPLNLGQHLLVGRWLSIYLYSLSQSDCGRILETFIQVISKLKNMCLGNSDQEIIMFVEKLWTELMAYLKKILSQTQLPFQVSALGASLASILLTTGHRERFKELFDLFVSNEINDIRLIRNFLSCLIQDCHVEKFPSQNNVIIKTWIRCCLICTDMNHKEMKDLTRYVSNLPEIKQFSQDLIENDEPLLLFFAQIHDKYLSTDIYHRQSLRESTNIYFHGMDKWLKPIVTSPRDFDQINRVFLTVGNLIRTISPLIYAKSKPNTVLQQLIDLTLLPVSVRNPDFKIPQNILQSIKLHLHLFIQGLFKLGPDQDHYIARLIKELLTIYLPRCVVLQNTLNFTHFSFVNEFQFFDRPDQFYILNTIACNFLKKKSRNPHNQALYALKFIKDIMASSENVQNVVVESTFVRICDVIMFCDDKHSVHSSAKDVLKFFLNTSAARGELLKDKIVTLLTSLGNEHLAWSSRQLFDLIVFLSSEAPDLTMRFLPKLLDIIKDVERKRGVGYDQSLRCGFERIETQIRKMKTGDL